MKIKIEAAQRLVVAEADYNQAKVYLKDLTGLNLSRLERERAGLIAFVLPTNVKMKALKERLTSKLGEPKKGNKVEYWVAGDGRFVRIYKSPYEQYSVIALEDTHD